VRLYLRFLAAIAVFAPAAAMARGPQPDEGSLSAEQTAGRTYDLSIEDAVALAQQRSFKTARAKRDLEESRLRYKNAKAQYLPTLTTSIAASQQGRDYASAGSTYQYQLSSSSNFQATANADLSMPIDVAGVIHRQVRQAELSQGIASQDVTDTALDVSLDVETSYLDALRAQNNADADEQVANEIAALLTRAGSNSTITSFLQVELANAQQTAQSSREKSDTAQDGLKQMLRIPPEEHLRLTSDFRGRKQSVDRNGLLERALRERPDIKSATLRVKQAATSVQQVSDSRAPTVRVGAFATQQLAGSAIYDGSYDRLRQEGGLVSVNVPLLQWDDGQLSRNKEIAEIQRDQADADLEELRERVSYDVREQLLAVTRAENRIRNLPDPKAALNALKRAEQMLLSAPPETAQGLFAQVSNARQAWRSAETATADAYIDYNLAVFRLKRLIGDTEDVRIAESGPAIPVQLVGPQLAP
jgi:outer membrane protein TolC